MDVARHLGDRPTKIASVTSCSNVTGIITPYHDIRQDCQRIGAPVLAIQGEDDPYGTMAQIDEIALPPSQIERVTLASCGHSPHRDQTRAATERIVHFLLRQA